MKRHRRRHRNVPTKETLTVSMGTVATTLEKDESTGSTYTSSLSTTELPDSGTAKKSDERTDDKNGHPSVSVQVPSASVQGRPPSPTPATGSTPAPADALPPRKPGKSKNVRNTINKFIDEVTAKGVSGYVEEFLNTDRIVPACEMNAFKANNHTGKNRYQDLGCLDTNRVILDDGTNDYINANYVSINGKPKKFIITQAPLDTTVADFWRMVAQEKCENIVMLCDFVEHNKVSCASYYPKNKGDKTMFENFEIANIAFSTIQLGDKDLQKIEVTKLKLTSTYGVSNISHYLLTSWPDRKLPQNSKLVMRLLTELRSKKKPVVVHCSTGAGRAGTFVGLEMLLETMFAGVEIPNWNILTVLRKQRAYAISTEIQYVFIFKQALKYLHRKHKIKKKDKLHAVQKFLKDYDALTKKTEKQK